MYTPDQFWDRIPRQERHIEMQHSLESIATQSVAGSSAPLHWLFASSLYFVNLCIHFSSFEAALPLPN